MPAISRRGPTTVRLAARSGLAKLPVTQPALSRARSSVSAGESRPPASGNRVEWPTTACPEVDLGLSRKPHRGLIMDMGIPSLVPEWRKIFSPETIVLDVAAGLTVGCIAVPLSLAIAVASGVPAEVGLVSAAVAGVAGGLLGGTTLAITGPAAAISLLVCEAVQTHGLSALPFITLCCGGLQLLTGIARGGVVTKFVPASVISGFTTGIGMMILTGQLPKALGLTVPGGLNTLEIFQAVGERVGDINPAALALALGTSASMLLLPKLHPKIPSALLAVGGATAATAALGLNVAKIGALPSGMAAFHMSAVAMPPLEALPALGTTIALIYAMTSVETLLSCSALDKMRPTAYKYNADQELIGQGVANMTSALFMGMPVTAVIARSSLNVKLKANTRLPSLVQAGFVFSSVAFFSDYMATVPMAALSGVLITSGISMLNPPELKHCLSVDRCAARFFAFPQLGPRARRHNLTRGRLKLIIPLVCQVDGPVVVGCASCAVVLQLLLLLPAICLPHNFGYLVSGTAC
jgi:carbonic anhydrase